MEDYLSRYQPRNRICYDASTDDYRGMDGLAMVPMIRFPAFYAVKESAREFAFQKAWSQRNKRPNICLAISRMYLEMSQAAYRVQRRMIVR